MRLVNGCSGRVEVKFNESWVSVREHDFDQQDAEVVCRQLGCGAPSVLQGALHGEGNVSTWNEEFQCEGNESALLDCRTANSSRNTNSPYKTVELTCSGKGQTTVYTFWFRFLLGLSPVSDHWLDWHFCQYRHDPIMTHTG